MANDAKEVAPAIRIAALQTLLTRRAHDEDFEAARRYLAAAEQLPADDGTVRQLSALRLALDTSGLFGQALRGYFVATNPTAEHRVAWANAVIAATPTQSPIAGVGWYLRGLRFMDQARWSEASADLQRGLAAGLPSQRFAINAARRLAVAAYRANDHGGVLAAIATLRAPEANDVDQLLANDWQARLQSPRPQK